MVSQPADLAAPIQPVVGLGERRARREAERLAQSGRPTSPRRAAATARRSAAPRRPAVVLRGSGGLPRVGIAAALGIATIVTPVLGSMGSTADASTAEAVAVPRTVSRAATTIALAPAMAESFRVVPGAAEEPVTAPHSLASAAEALTADQLAAIRDQATQASRNQERAVLPGCDGKPIELSAANGRIDRDDLCELWSGERLRADAAVALARLNADFASRFGRDLCVTDGYRSYSEQVSVRWRKPGLAARPGTSQHGWGLAVDLCKGEAAPGADQHVWLRENAPDFGWDNPDWARSGGSGPFEPWHWEYVAGQDERS